MTLSPDRPRTRIVYPDTDGKPMAESDPTRDSLVYAVEALKLYFESRSDLYISGNLFIYYEQGVPDAVVSPDVFAIAGAGNRPRVSYRVWEEGGLTPDFVLEITSASTRRTDRVEKVRTYAQLGVEEYFQYDPSGEYLEPALQGLQLVGDRYQPLAATTNQAGELVLQSAVLGLELRLLTNGAFRFFEPASGRKLLSYQELARERQQAEVELQRAETERQQAQVERQRAETERQQAETERQQAEAARLQAAQRLLELDLPVEQVATILSLPVEQVQRLRDRA